MHETSSVPLPLEYSQSCIESGISFSRMTYWVNALKSRAKYLRFLNSCMHHPIRNRNRGHSRCMDTGFGSEKP